MRAAILLAAMLMPGAIAGDDVQPIRLPVIVLPEPPEPEPQPETAPVTTLPADQWYVVESDDELITIDVPAGIVSVEHDSGPLRMRGRFAGGTGRVETRTFTGPHIYLIEAAKAGTVELILVPIGVESAEHVVRTRLVVSGNGPQPPPGPDPKPQPDDDKSAGPITLAIVEDPLERSPETAIVLSQLATWTALRDAGHDWRIYDMRTREPKGQAATLAVTKAGLMPPAVVVTAASGKVSVFALPATFDELRSAVNRHTATPVK